jgi:chaperonin GroES
MAGAAAATARPPKKNLLAKPEPAKFAGRVLHDNVLVRTKVADAVTPGGIVLPDIAQNRQQPNSGTVVAIGPGKPLAGETELWPVAVKVGDKVVFSAYAGTKVEIGDEELIVLAEKEILLVL